MSLFSRIVFVVATLIGFVLLIVSKGLPVLASPDPKAVTDVVLQPYLGMMWGLLGYLVNAAVFGGLVTLGLKIARSVVTFVLNSTLPDSASPPQEHAGGRQ